MRLVDADEVLNAIYQYAREDGYINLHIGTIDTIISNVPTVEERPHGEWKQVTAKDGEYYCHHKCTNCGQTIESGFDNPPIFNFCPNCGASMAKEGEAE